MLKSFKEVQQKEAAYETRNRGFRSVPLAQIVGSVGRYLDFDERFRIRPHVPVERLDKIKSRMREGKMLPPVKLYQIKKEYYALDGNHRIAAANELGYDEIQA
ncbi:MAG: ParB N-terminal domain-containing protein, partial [Desulfobacterales bacterium]